MPIFEYICTDCRKKFEAIVYGANQAECPACHGKRLEQQLSVFAVSNATKSSGATDSAPSPCGSCGHPDGPGSCAFEN